MPQTQPAREELLDVLIEENRKGIVIREEMADRLERLTERKEIKRVLEPAIVLEIESLLKRNDKDLERIKDIPFYKTDNEIIEETYLSKSDVKTNLLSFAKLFLLTGVVFSAIILIILSTYSYTIVPFGEASKLISVGIGFASIALFYFLIDLRKTFELKRDTRILRESEDQLYSTIEGEVRSIVKKSR